MIDPDSIIVQHHNDHNILKFKDIPEYDFITYDLDDEKQLKRYYSNIEREIRHSFEYRRMIKYLKEYMGMDNCSFIQVSSRDSYNIIIEIHHYPFSLYDVVNIVYKKRIYYQESLDVELVAKEVTILHYKLLVGLIPLSKSVHQLVHAGKLFIPVQNVLGRYQLFVDFYKQFCTPEQLDTLDRIEKYSIEQVSDLYNSQNILEQNNISIENYNNNYQLPDLNNINNTLNTRIEDIKSNNYKLPLLNEDKSMNNRFDNNTVKSPFYFSKNE